MEQLPFLNFRPILKTVVWGGDKLKTLLHKELVAGSPIGESWEIVDLCDAQSIVSDGPLTGKSLEWLCKKYPEALLGDVQLLEGKFPLLFKFIDAAKTLSVQVHPDIAASARIAGARPKTEAWYIIDREPGAVLYVGFNREVTRENFHSSLKNGTVEEILCKLEVNPGDFVYLPAGTVHAIGEGVVLAEVQQSSNTTYRVFDWNRVGLDGKPRELHVEQALDSLNYQQIGAPVIVKPSSGRDGLVSPFFAMEALTPKAEWESFSARGPIALMCVKREGVNGAGEIELKSKTSSFCLTLGQSVLVPACLASSLQIRGNGKLKAIVTSIPPAD